MDRSFQITAQCVDVVARTISPSTVTVVDGVITKIESASLTNGAASKYLLPGFVDAHIHIESSMLLPNEFARAAVLHGTVATVSDPHEIANVCGVEGIELMLRDAEQSPLKFHFGAPSCVPATNFETAGAKIDVADIELLLDHPLINHLSEMMNFPGVISGDPLVAAKLAAAQKRGMPIDGHAPGLRGDDARRYFAAGITTDHECVSLDEAIEKISLGCKIAIREGSAARNFEALWPLLDRHPDACMFCSDDKHPDELLVGHMNQLVARAVKNGCDLFNVLRAASFNPISHYSLSVGMLQVGDPADFVVVNDLVEFTPKQTYIDGQLVMDAGEALFPASETSSVNNFAAEPIAVESIRVEKTSDQIRVIDVHDGQLITSCVSSDIAATCQVIEADCARDILKLVVLNRYQVAEPAVAFVRGFGLRNGALASSVAHDSHNIVAVGTNDNELIAAINGIVESRGGLSFSADGRVDSLPLPVAGLISTKSCVEVAAEYAQLDALVKEAGCCLRAPFMTLSFLALPVIPSLKLTDKGLFDVERFGHVPLAL